MEAESEIADPVRDLQRAQKTVLKYLSRSLLVARELINRGEHLERHPGLLPEIVTSADRASLMDEILSVIGSTFIATFIITSKASRQVD